MKQISWMLALLGICLLLTPAFDYAYSSYQQYILIKSLAGAEAEAKVQLVSVENIPVIEAKEPINSINQLEDSSKNTKTAVSKEKEEVTPQKADNKLLPKKPSNKVSGIFIISIPKIKVKAAVVKGVGENELRVGPGMYPESAMPGEMGNVAIAGHRNMYGSWFRNVHKLEKGDEINIEYLNEKYTYEVQEVFTCAVDDWSVVEKTDYKALTLTTCDPPGAVTHRLVVRAILK